MKSLKVLEPVEERQALRQRMSEQRQLIAYQLGPKPAVDRAYPRSMTMRFLTQRPELAARLGGLLAAQFLGARVFKVMSTALALAKIVRSASGRK